MIKTLEKTGRTEDLALEAALSELGLNRDDVSYSYEIIQRAKSGFFGIGASPAKILVKYEVPDEKPAKKPESAAKPAVQKEQKAAAPKEQKQAEKPQKKASEEKPEKKVSAPEEKSAAAGENPEYARIREFLEGLFERMGVKAEMEISPRENGGINVALSGNGMGAVIGRRGETLDAIQHITNYVINRGSDKRMHINIDAEEYRSKREESLTRLAEKMAEKAIKYKRNMALEPMNSYERHVIHTALQNYEGVTTASTGEEPNRRVVVNYVKQESDKASASKPKSREWA